MKVLYDIATGRVILRISDIPSPLPPIHPVPAEGQALVTVPESVLIPDAIVRVVESDTGLEFVVDNDLVQAQWASIKTHRNQLLKDSDWVCSVTDYTPPNKEGWIVYRQGLRDITQQVNPFRIVWPVVSQVSVPVSVPTVPVDPVPTVPVESVPTVPVESVPTVPVDPVPTVPVDPVPTVPVDPVPTVPVDPVPTVPVESVPTVPVDLVPTVPVDPVPSDPVPTVPVDPVPTVPVESVPTVPVESVPSDPVPTVPVDPVPSVSS